jgi:hypothetical protein
VELGAIQWEGAIAQCRYLAMRDRVGSLIKNWLCHINFIWCVYQSNITLTSNKVKIEHYLFVLKKCDHIKPGKL